MPSADDFGLMMATVLALGVAFIALCDYYGWLE